MKTITKNIGIILSAITLFIVIGTPKANAQRGDVSFQVFYDQLSPYGEWIDDVDYGYIWLPYEGQDQNFQPYGSNGRWVNTQYGNTWYSDYEWGWAPFHYGRWVRNNYYGWAWVPGYEWGPAWVSWRQGGGQYGWAPLGPGMQYSVNINIPLLNWIFVPQRYFFNASVYRYYTPYNRYRSFYNRTTIINNVYVYNNNNYYSGPDRRSLERSTRNRVDVIQVRNSNRPDRSSLNSRSVEMYTPNVSRTENPNTRPSRVASADRGTDRSSINTSTRPTSDTRSTATTRPGRQSGVDNGTTANDRNSRPSSSRTQATTAERDATSRPSRSNTNATSNGENTSGSSRTQRDGRANTSNDRGTRPSATTTEETGRNSAPIRSTRENTDKPKTQTRETRSTTQEVPHRFTSERISSSNGNPAPVRSVSTAPARSTTTAPTRSTTTAPTRSTTTAPARSTTTAPARNTTTAPARSTTTAPARSTTTAPASSATKTQSIRASRSSRN